jgi:hypothetical protein
MYETLKAISYPFIDIPHAQASGPSRDAVRRCIVDFRLQVHSPSALSGHPRATVTSIFHDSGSLKVGLVVVDGLTELARAEHLVLTPTAPASENLVRYHFDASDFAYVAPGLAVEGWICTDELTDLVAVFASILSGTSFSLELEPATISVFSMHKVRELRCRNAKPLLMQAAGSRYQATSAPIDGNVKLVAGANCSISVQEASNLVAISPQPGVNDTQAERCGAWADPVGSKDVLCGDVIYGISGAVPDSTGNLRITAEQPLAASTLSREQLLEKSADFASVMQSVPPEVRFVIHVGLPAGPNNASVFDCEGA